MLKGQIDDFDRYCLINSQRTKYFVVSREDAESRVGYWQMRVERTI